MLVKDAHAIASKKILPECKNVFPESKVDTTNSKDEQPTPHAFCLADRKRKVLG